LIFAIVVAQDPQQVCQYNSDCVPLPSECAPIICINSQYSSQYTHPDVCPMIFDQCAAYDSSSCECGKDNLCINIQLENNGCLPLTYDQAASIQKRFNSMYGGTYDSHVVTLEQAKEYYEQGLLWNNTPITLGPNEKWSDYCLLMSHKTVYERQSNGPFSTFDGLRSFLTTESNHPHTCVQSVMRCPNGEYVSPKGPNCTVPPCPTRSLIFPIIVIVLVALIFICCCVGFCCYLRKKKQVIQQTRTIPMTFQPQQIPMNMMNHIPMNMMNQFQPLPYPTPQYIPMYSVPESTIHQ